MYQQLYTPKDRKARIAQCMSGSGTNVEKVIAQEERLGKECQYETVAILTDDKRSKAEIIAYNHLIQYIQLDIRDFQESKGLGRKLTLATEAHRKAREEYTAELAGRLRKLEVDFIVFGGFEPLTNIAGEFPCLNVHPGDLTYQKDGKPYLVGLHTVPIQRALDQGIGYVRSSVIQALPYTGIGDDMDNGPILGLGPKLFYEGERDAKKIQDALKRASDWVILPAVVLAVARGEIEVDHETNEVRNQVIMDLEYRISEIREVN